MANKQDLIAKVAEATELTKKDSAAAVDAVFSAIESFLTEGEKVQIIGFGTVSYTHIRAHETPEHIV